jgi:hypothetical protein
VSRDRAAIVVFGLLWILLATSVAFTAYDCSLESRPGLCVLGTLPLQGVSLALLGFGTFGVLYGRPAVTWGLALGNDFLCILIPSASKAFILPLGYYTVVAVLWAIWRFFRPAP